MFTASATALSYALVGLPVFAAGAVLAVVLRRQVIPKMDALPAEMQASGAQAIAAFRRMHDGDSGESGAAR